AKIAFVPHVRCADAEVFRLDHRVRHSAERIATKSVIVPLFRCELSANALIERETGNAPVIRAQDRSFHMDNEMLERRKRESHGPAAFKVDAVETPVYFAAGALSGWFRSEEIVRH